MSGRHARTRPMRTDDTVAPGVRRSKAALFTAAGIIGIVLAIAGIALTLSQGVEHAQDSAQLSQDETRQLREFLADRGKQRDQEKAETQAQLDQQRAVLCAAIRTLEQSARPEPRKVLAKAAADLRCAALPATTRPTSSSTTSSGDAISRAPATPTPTGTVPAGKAPGRPAPAAPAARPSQPASPTGTTAPSLTPTATARPGVLDPILGPVCVLGVCL